MLRFPRESSPLGIAVSTENSQYERYTLLKNKLNENKKNSN